MSEVYDRLLDAAIRHLEDVQAHGVKFATVSPDTLAALRRTGGASRDARPSAVRARAGGPTLETPQPAPPVAPVALAPPPPTAELILPSPSAATEPSPLSPAAKTAAFAGLRLRALACVKCSHLAASRRNVVFGVGSPDAELMFVGEAPGADEDAQGEPFVGKAGQLLTKIIQTMGFARNQVYIANILKCRPDTPGQPFGNRKPTPEEMETCIPWLHEQIDLIRPRLIVALGATAVEGLLGKTVGITRLRGQWREYRGIPLMPTYHPAYLLRNQALGEKRKVWEDMLQVLEKLGRPISAKQRNYFLKT